MKVHLKNYPRDYPDDVVAILDTMSLTNGSKLHIVGSMSVREQLYAGDYDAYETVSATSTEQIANLLSDKTLELSRMPNVYFGELKAGYIEEFRIIPHSVHINLKTRKIEHINKEHSFKVLENMKSILTNEQYNEAKNLISHMDSIEGYLKASSTLKYHIIRWNQSEVIEQSKQLINGSYITLSQALTLSKSLVKMDVIGLVQNYRYTDFSCIYEIRINGKIITEPIKDLEESLAQDIFLYMRKGNLFKALKRYYALGKYKKNSKVVDILTVNIFNTDLGRIYSIVSDLETLITILENHKNLTAEKLAYEVSQLIIRLSNIVLPELLQHEKAIINKLDILQQSILNNNWTNAIKTAELLKSQLNDILQHYTKLQVKKLNIKL